MVCKPANRFYALLATAALLLAITACDSRSTSSDQQQGIQMHALNFQEWNEQLTSYQPSIVVVDMWAMWCASCIKRFPKMVDLHEQYSSRGVEIVSLNLDNREDQAAVQQAEEFLREINATFDNFHMDENLIEAFERFNLIGIPAVLIYDSNGEERFRLTGDNPNSQFTDEDIEDAINELLGEEAA
ncbi:MAG: TlpA disulfide reductase family protein [Cellvibrionaceae bacterium]